MQHTSVECTWDEGEKVRESRLTNISQWRELNESELQQYIASSDSEGEEDDDEEEDVPTDSKGRGKETKTNR